MRTILLLITLAIAWCSPLPAQGADATYWAYVGAESADLLHVVRFGPDGAAVEKTLSVGQLPKETEGPHGLRVSRDGKYLYMTTGHGNPDGKLWKIETGVDTLVAEPIFLGWFPATLDLTPDGLYVFVANFNLHGEHIPSTVSAVYTPTLTEVAQTTTCTMPHGMRMRPDGLAVYSACMLDDQIVEIDTRTFEVTRRFSVRVGSEGPIEMYDPSEHTDPKAERVPNTCGPTWALPTADKLYVACNKGDGIYELSLADWAVTRKFSTGRGPYNLDMTPDGTTLIATLKQSAAVEFFDIAGGKSRGITEASAPITHGVVVSPDSRYGFVTVESIGADPGRVDIFDIRTTERVASVQVGQQAGGIAFWKMENRR
jgi:DNA-binding beta-propeller fold protein YncE